MKNKIKIIVLMVLGGILIVFLLYRYFNYNIYKNTTDYMPLYFKNSITIKHKETKKTKTFGEMTFLYFFANYKKGNADNIYEKYDKKKEMIATFSLDVNPLFINVLSEDAFELVDDDTEPGDIKTKQPMAKYLIKHNITNDIDLIKYVQRYFPFRSSILTPVRTMQNRYILNTFASAVLANAKCVTIIEGDLNGYIVEFMGTANKEIHLIYKNNQYLINLLGDEITNEKFITELLESISFSEQE